MPATQSVPSIFLTEESPKKPKRLHCKVKQRSHEAQPVNLGTDSWPSAAHPEPIPGRLPRREQVILPVGRARWAPGREFCEAGQKSGCGKSHQIGNEKRPCVHKQDYSRMVA